MICRVCSVHVLKTREPKAVKCTGCGKILCPKHAHYYVDESNIAITMGALPKCATCSGKVTIHCFWPKCPHIVEHRDPEQGSRIMQAHYDEAHEAELVALGYGGAS